MYKAFISYSHAADNKLAPALQSALEKFAKPWYKKRNLEIFRDEGSLAANPHLWTNITKALDQSEYMIYMASPTSEKSKWINKEITYWLELKSIDTLLIALTEGDLSWDDENNCFKDPANNSLPPVLDDKFDAEPFYIDLRNSKTQEDISLENPIFKKEVLKLAAHLHGMQPKDLASEEVTAHSKMIRVRNAAIGALAFLFIAALSAGWFANVKRIEANQRTIEANNEKKIAQANYLISEAKSSVTTDPTLALRLAEEAMKKNNDEKIIESAIKIYSENAFYKIVGFHENGINSAIFSPDGKMIITASDDSTTRLWDINGKILRTFKDNTGAVNCVAFSPDGKTILTGSSNNISSLWNLNGRIIHQFEGHTDGITSVAFSPDGKTILTGSKDKTARLWDLNGNTLKELAGHFYEVTTVAFSPGGDKIITGSSDNTSCLWNTDGTLLKKYYLNKSSLNEPLTVNYLKGHYYEKYFFKLSPDGKSVLIIFLDGIARLFDLEGKKVHEFNEVNSYATSAAFSPDGKKVLISSIDFVSRLMDLTGNVLEVFKGHSDLINSVTFSSDGKTFLTSSRDGKALLWNIKNNSLQFNLDSTSFLTSFFLSDRNIFAADMEGNAYLFDLNENLIKKFPGYSSRDINSDYPSHDRKKILSLFANRSAILWDFKGNIIHEFKDQSYPIYCACFSPYGDSILVGSEGNKPIRLLDLNGKVLSEFIVDASYASLVKFSPDGKMIFIVSSSGVIYLCTPNGKILKEFKVDEPYPSPNIALSPDGKLFLTASWGETVLRDLNGSIFFKSSLKYGFSQITFSPDGKKIAQTTSDTTAILYDLKGNILQKFRIPSNHILSIAFSPDGKKILTAGFSEYSAYVRVWDVVISLFDFLKSDKIEPLSADQKNQYSIE